MRLVLAIVLAGLVALPLSAGAQDGDESATVEPSAEEPAPSSEPAPEEPALELKLGEAGVEVRPSRWRTVTLEEAEQMELRVKRAKIGLGASGAVASAGAVLMLVAAFGDLSGGELIGGDPAPDWVYPAAVAGGVAMGAGVVGMITAGGISLRRQKKLRGMWAAHYGTREEVSVDTSDDAFMVVVTRKYDGAQLTGASVFIRHTDSGRDANPYIEASMIDSLDDVIHEHKERLLSGE